VDFVSFIVLDTQWTKRLRTFSLEMSLYLFSDNFLLLWWNNHRFIMLSFCGLGIQLGHIEDRCLSLFSQCLGLIHNVQVVQMAGGGWGAQLGPYVRGLGSGMASAGPEMSKMVFSCLGTGMAGTCGNWLGIPLCAASP
jgi:hypothetical protein